MANVFFNLPAPAGNGAGAAVDVSSMGALKTVTVGSVQGVFQPFVTIEFSCDAGQTIWQALDMFQAPGEKTFSVACLYMRAVVSNYRGGGAPNCDVGGEDLGTTGASLAATTGNGTAAATDVSALPTFKTIQVGSTFRGAVNVEISEDGTDYETVASFQKPGFFTAPFAASHMRVVRAGVPSNTPGLPVVRVCGAATGGGGGGGSDDPPYVDLRLAPYNVVADDDDPAVALANTTAVNQAIVDFDGTFACLAFPQGTIYLDKVVGSPWSIKFGTGISNLTLMGWGQDATRLVQQGTSVPGEWDLLVIDGAQNIEIKAMTLEQGIIQIPDPGQQNHLLCVYNNTLGGTTQFIHVWNLKFGKCIGDQLRILADNDGDAIVDSWFHDLDMDGEGSSIQAWAPATNYAQFEWVDNGGQMYQCATAGVSGPGPGPTGTGIGIADPGGTAIWDSDTNLIGARSGVAVQRGFDRIYFWNISIRGERNQAWDFEPTSTGTALMQNAWIRGIFVDNRFGNVSDCVSISGNSAQQLLNIQVIDFEIQEGGCSFRYNDDLYVENLFVTTTEPMTVAATPNVLMRSTNNRARFKNPTIKRIGTSGTGMVWDADGSFGDITIEGGLLIQNTPTYPIFFGGADNLNVTDLRIVYAGAISPAGFGAFTCNIVDANLQPTITGLQIENQHVLAMRCAIELQVRAPRTLANVQITNLTAPGEVTYGVIIGAGVGAVYDQFPIIQSCEVGAAELYRFEDAGGGLTITDIYPITGGSRALLTMRRLEGLRTPNGNVVGNLGDAYVWRPTTSTSATYVKASETVAGTPDNTGWQLVTGLTLTPAALAAGSTQDYAPTNLVSAAFLRIATNVANSDLGGLLATGIADAQEIRILNLGPGTLTLNEADAGSAAANQFALEGAANRVIGVNGIVIVKRDNTLTKWLCVG